MNAILSNRTKTKNVWVKTGSQSPNWLLGTVNLGTSLGELAPGWNLQFESEPSLTGVSAFSDDIAIDDISFSNCNPADHLKPLRCNFDKDFCGWANDPTGSNFNWTRNNGSTSSDDTGPPGDQ